MPVYPTSLLGQQRWADEVDDVSAYIVNTFNDEIVTIETTLGTNPQGNRANVSHRLNAAISGSGGFNVLAADPVETYPGKFWYRSDLSALRSVKLDNTIETIGGSFSNIAFEFFYGGQIGISSQDSGIIEGSGSTFNTVAVHESAYWNNGATYRTAYITKFYKIAGISSIDYHFYLTCSSGTAERPKVQFSVGSAVSTVVGGVTTTSFGKDWVNNTLDISGLDNGTVYDLVVELKGTDTTGSFGGYTLLFKGIGFGK